MRHYTTSLEVNGHNVRLDYKAPTVGKNDAIDMEFLKDMEEGIKITAKEEIEEWESEGTLSIISWGRAFRHIMQKKVTRTWDITTNLEIDGRAVVLNYQTLVVRERGAYDMGLLKAVEGGMKLMAEEAIMEGHVEAFYTDENIQLPSSHMYISNEGKLWRIDLAGIIDDDDRQVIRDGVSNEVVDVLIDEDIRRDWIQSAYRITLVQ